MNFASIILLSSTFLAAQAEIRMTESGLGIETVFVPENCDMVTKKNHHLNVKYTGRLQDGTVFDSSDEGFDFQLGAGAVIKGWDEGLLGMCSDEKRRLVVPPELGYGDAGAGDKIPGGATLYFDVELIGFEEGEPPTNVFKEIDTDENMQVTREELTGYLNKQIEQMKQSGGEEAEQVEKMMPEQDKFIEEIFGHDDKNKDGVISFDEFSGPKHDEL